MSALHKNVTEIFKFPLNFVKIFEICHNICEIY